MPPPTDATDLLSRAVLLHLPQTLQELCGGLHDTIDFPEAEVNKEGEGSLKCHFDLW